MRAIGPELISGASDNDPTNIGTAAVVGARTSYQLSWVALLVGPLLYVVLAVAGQVGAATGSDMQSLTVKHYGRMVGALLLISLVVVNVATIAADLQAGAAAVGLLIGADSRWLVLPLGLGVAGLLMIGRYGQVVAVLRYLLPGFLAFTAAAVIARPDWPRVLAASLVPDLSLARAEPAGALALLGTTLTGYVYVWETVQRGPEEPASDRTAGRAGRIGRVRAGAAAGGAFTAVILWSILVAAASTLGLHHRPASSASDAAAALRPLAGSLARELFAAGLVISALAALPVLVASTGYVIGAHFDWRRGLSQPVSRAGRFYAVVAASIVIATITSLAGVPVLGMLVAASVIGGLGTPVGLVILLCLARNRKIMNGTPVSVRLAAAGWMITVFVGGLGLLFLTTAA